MAVEEKVVCINLLAAGDLSADQYKFVTFNGTDKTVDLTATAGGSVDGILQDEPAAAGRSAKVAISGRVKVLAGAAVAAGADVATDATGRAVTATGAAEVVGKSVIAGAVAGDVMEIILKGKGASTSALALRVPSNIETAAFTAAVNATWENYNIITALNLVLATNIAVTRAVQLRGVLEFITSDALGPYEAKFNDGDAPDGDDTTNAFTTAAAAGSEFINVDLITDATGQIKIEVDDRTKLTMIFHLKSYSYVQNVATL